MEIQLEAQNTIPQELGHVETADAYSFTQALQTLQSNPTGKQALRISAPLKLNRGEKNSLMLLPKAFGLNRTMQKLEFWNLEVDDGLVAEAVKAGIRNDNVTCIDFMSCRKVCNERLLESLCEGLKERSTAFQLNLENCSSDFMKPILEASYLNCFSINFWFPDFSETERPFKNLILRGRIYYISLNRATGLKKDFFLRLGRCLLPNLRKLNLVGTEIPKSALKRLIGSLKQILGSGRSNLFQDLDLGKTLIGSKMCFAFCRLLRHDLIVRLSLTLKIDISRAVVKHISSTLANTKNLRYLSTGSYFSSGTNFKSFILQQNDYVFRPPFGVNPTAA